MAFIGSAILACLFKGPREPGWFGWSGGWKMRRDDLPHSSGGVERAIESQAQEDIITTPAEKAINPAHHTHQKG